MKLTDVVAVVGLQNRATEMVTSLCQSLGIEVFYAMQKDNPKQRINAIGNEAVVASPFEQVPDNVFCMGLMAADSLFQAGTLDCNITQEREMFGHVLGWFAHRVGTPEALPAGWQLLKDLPVPAHADYEQYVQGLATGKILADGKMVCHFGGQKCLVQIPQDYKDVFALLEGHCV